MSYLILVDAAAFALRVSSSTVHGAGPHAWAVPPADRWNGYPTIEAGLRNISNSLAIVFKCDDGYTVTGAESRVTELRNWLEQNARRLCEVELPSGFTLLGEYLAFNSHINRVVSLTRYRCPHCAVIAASGVAGRSDSSTLVLSPGATPETRFMPYQAEFEIATETTRPSTTATIKDGERISGNLCGTCGRPNHNARACTNGPKYFDKIGIELEGRYTDRNQMRNFALDEYGADCASDGSIAQSPESAAQPYEFKTHPGNLRHAIDQVVDLYPDEADKSCGMHIHVSFAPEVITLLNTNCFFKYFRERWQAWGVRMGLHPESQFFKRLRGDNNYCMVNAEPVRSMRDMDRYHQLNFSSWESHKTVECRLLPLFRRSSLAVAAVLELISIYEDFLRAPEEFGFTTTEVVSSVNSTGIARAPHREEMSFEYNSAMLSHKSESAIELADVTPCPDGRVRIALPVNAPITVEVLAARLSALQAAQTGVAACASPQ